MVWNLNAYPDVVRIETGEGKWMQLSSSNQQLWQINDTIIDLEEVAKGYSVKVDSPSIPLNRIQLSFRRSFSPETKFLGDAFERGYGDLGFEMLKPDRLMHWYFVAVDQNQISCYGVMTSPNALCTWQVSDTAIDLWMDIRNGTGPLQLQNRVLEAATIVFDQMDNQETFAAITDFCRTMCPQPNLPSEPIYGGNDWYYAYGNNSKELIIEHTKLISELSISHAVRPFMVIDDGWQVNHSPEYNGGPWHCGNQKFGSMQEIAQTIRQMDVRPGIWYRPLLTQHVDNQEHILHSDLENGEYVLDISHPDVLNQVGDDIERMVDWGFEMIKHDYSTYDIFGKYGFEMDIRYTSKDIHFHDKEHTTAEIIKAFYTMIQQRSKDAYVMGCNTLSHLAAGVFEIQRTGDDTSGRLFQRTRKMGVNTLAYRMPQHGTFYLSDADCVGITTEISWEQNVEWLRALSNSGTPLFISCNPNELTEAMKRDLQEAFHLAAKGLKLSVPLDWISNPYPSLWKTELGQTRYEWYLFPRSFE